MRETRNEYLPKKAVIERVIGESADTKTFTLKLKERMRYKPGQFLMLSLPGYGEAPFTFASAPGKEGKLQVSVRKVGFLTNALHSLKEEDSVGIRGPYGNWFPLDKIKGKDILFIAGGCGIAPLRSLIQYVFKHRKEYGRIEVIYGCRRPNDIFYKEEIKAWEKNEDSNVHLTVDEPDETWGGACGVVCVLLPKINVNPAMTMVFLCGPSVMIKFAIKDIVKLGFKEQNIYASLERYMKCGIGKCGHCYVKGKYACMDGPNFSYTEMKKLGIES